MSLSRKSLYVFLYILFVCILLGVMIVQFRGPILFHEDWSGVQMIRTTTPSPTLFPAPGWLNDMPTPPGPGSTPTPTLKPNSAFLIHQSAFHS